MLADDLVNRALRELVLLLPVDRADLPVDSMKDVLVSLESRAYNRGWLDSANTSIDERPQARPSADLHEDCGSQ
jgi:hypothetical protein